MLFQHRLGLDYHRCESTLRRHCELCLRQLVRHHLSGLSVRVQMKMFEVFLVVWVCALPIALALRGLETAAFQSLVSEKLSRRTQLAGAIAWAPQAPEVDWPATNTSSQSDAKHAVHSIHVFYLRQWQQKIPCQEDSFAMWQCGCTQQTTRAGLSAGLMTSCLTRPLYAGCVCPGHAHARAGSQYAPSLRVPYTSVESHICAHLQKSWNCHKTACMQNVDQAYMHA